jgi:hypothetical protein
MTPVTADKLLACLRSVVAPANVEEWLLPDVAGAPDRELLRQDSAYAQAIHDLLKGLGVVSPDGKTTSPMAYYFVQSLLSTIRDGALTEQSWQGLPDEGCAGSGARLVHLLEETRMACAADPMPLRIVRASTAVIKARQGSDDVYLMQYDMKARQFQPIGGKQEISDGSSEAALTRELCEELALTDIQVDRDFSLNPLAVDIQVDEISASLHVMTRYTHSFYHLTDVRFPLPTDQFTRWLTGAEMTSGRTIDGYAVSTLFEEYIPGVLPTLAYSLPSPLP